MARDSYTRYPRPILWLIEGGELTVGGEEDNAKPSFEAVVEPFYISKFPVTNEQYEAFDPGFERSPLSTGDRDPAAGVDFAEAAAYCEWYAGVARKPIRLPTEVEWEHACRGGSTGHVYYEDGAEDDFAWHRGNCEGRLQPLDAKTSNPTGLWGMLGGVWEWTSSLYRPYPLQEPFADPSHVEGRRVLRGGSIELLGSELTCSLRRAGEPREQLAGFRIVKSFR